MAGICLATIRARNAEYRKKQEALKAKLVAEELTTQNMEEKKAVEEKEEEKPARKPSKRKYLVIDEEAPKDEDKAE